jgi:tRNA1Val (adenine37-N6)-methyltransferase
LAAYTVDTLFDPPLTLFQPVTGYRFSLDPVILAGHVLPGPKDRVMDIGCGCGILCLILAGRHPEISITGIEIQKDLADLAQKNAVCNHMTDRIRIRHQDIQTLSVTDVSAPMDLIVSNPPYKKKSTGRVNPDRGRALARHEITLDIHTLAACAHAFLRPEGRLSLIFPASRTTDLTVALGHAGFRIDWIRHVHFYVNDAAQRVLVSAVKSGSGAATRCPPLYLYHPDGTPTRAHSALFEW